MASLSITDSPSVGFTCFWRIKDFYLSSSNTKLSLKSQLFKVIFERHCECHLELRRQKEFLGLYLFKRMPQDSQTIQFTMSILTSSGWLTIIRSSEIEINGDSNGYGTHNFIEWRKIFDYKDVYMPNDCLTISCHLWDVKTAMVAQQVLLTSRMANKKSLIHSRVEKFSLLEPSDFIYIPAEITSKLNNETEVKGESSQTDQICSSTMLYHKDVLLTKKEFCYVTLRTANKDFAVYKELICTRSPVFSAMFEKDMKNKNIIDIKDVDSETLDLLLKFLHLNPLGDLKWDAIVKLYYAANKYQIEQLKKECVIRLKNQLNTENFCEILLLSDMHQDENLKLVVKQYFCKNSKKILISQSWSDFLLNKTKLAHEMLLALAERL